jgi:hypothetical protein
MHVAILPVLLGDGERLFDRLDDGFRSRYECVELDASQGAAHGRIVRRR